MFIKLLFIIAVMINHSSQASSEEVNNSEFAGLMSKVRRLADSTDPQNDPNHRKTFEHCLAEPLTPRLLTAVETGHFQKAQLPIPYGLDIESRALNGCINQLEVGISSDLQNGSLLNSLYILASYYTVRAQQSIQNNGGAAWTAFQRRDHHMSEAANLDQQNVPCFYLSWVLQDLEKVNSLNNGIGSPVGVDLIGLANRWHTYLAQFPSDEVQDFLKNPREKFEHKKTWNSFVEALRQKNPNNYNDLFEGIMEDPALRNRTLTPEIVELLIKQGLPIPYNSILLETAQPKSTNKSPLLISLEELANGKNLHAQDNLEVHYLRNHISDIFFRLIQAFNKGETPLNELCKAEEIVVRWQINNPHALAIWQWHEILENLSFRYDWSDPAKPRLKNPLLNELRKLTYNQENLDARKNKQVHEQRNWIKKNFFKLIQSFNEEETSLNELHEAEEIVVTWQIKNPHALAIWQWHKDLKNDFLMYDWRDLLHPQLKQKASH